MLGPVLVEIQHYIPDYKTTFTGRRLFTCLTALIAGTQLPFQQPGRRLNRANLAALDMTFSTSSLIRSLLLMYSARSLDLTFLVSLTVRPCPSTTIRLSLMPVYPLKIVPSVTYYYIRSCLFFSDLQETENYTCAGT